MLRCRRQTFFQFGQSCFVHLVFGRVLSDPTDDGLTAFDDFHRLVFQDTIEKRRLVDCLFNEAFDPVGVNFGTKTTSPRVVRTPRRGQREQ